ncbi:hypothetical protein SORBI_3008G103000 [Sorghum bicolor]|uniref:BTB domain-containing protein n=1 Tax=Sorghum bicolor TaxID=4558 RepID=A0A1Z5R5W8_SORBI|nr:hypothetical protein SORBI_3008G103000 [Sorghum bicolor]
MDLTLTSTHLSYVARSTHLLNISNYSLPSTHSKVYCKSSVEVDGFEWEIRFYPMCSPHYQLELQLVFLGEAGADKLTAALSCRMVDPSGTFEPTAEKTSETTSFQHHSDSSQPLVIVSIFEAIDLPYRYRPYFDSNNESLTVECTVTVFRDPEAIPVPSSNNLQQHLGELLASKAGSDVTFTVSGESFPAHKNVVAARSPEKSSGRVEIKEMEAPVFGAMLRFIYTDVVPELDDVKPAEAATATATTATTLAQHLLVAADRYGLDRLKVMCERRLAFAVDAAGSVAATLAIAEQHGCSRLKAKCVEFIAGGSRENLDAVLRTDGFKDLEVNHPALLTELLVAAHGRKKD